MIIKYDKIDADVLVFIIFNINWNKMLRLINFIQFFYMK